MPPSSIIHPYIYVGAEGGAGTSGGAGYEGQDQQPGPSHINPNLPYPPAGGSNLQPTPTGGPGMGAHAPPTTPSEPPPAGGVPQGQQVQPAAPATRWIPPANPGIAFSFAIGNQT